MSDLARLAVESALARIADRLRAEGFADERSAIAEARRRGWLDGDYITDAGFAVGEGGDK